MNQSTEAAILADAMTEAQQEPRQAVRCSWLSELVRRMFADEPEQSTNERMRRLLGRRAVDARPNCRLIER